jgi:nucleoside phosphorylase
MIKILIIEDEAEKRRLLVETILEVESMSNENLTFVSDVWTAKKTIAAERFDLLILDINIPRSADKVAESGAGLDVMSYIKNNMKAKRPSFIVGMTAYEDSANAAEEVFASPLWKLVRFSYKELTWQAPLREAIRYLLSNYKPPYLNDGKSHHVDLGIIVALEDEELKSIRALDGNWTEIEVAHDHARYFSGRFEQNHRSVTVVAVAAPKMGMPPAAIAASKLIQSFRPKYLAITGICAGVRGKANIGDILIADPCFDWGSGKWVRDPETTDLKFRPAHYPWRLDERLRSGARKLADEDGFLSNLHSAFPSDRRPAAPPRVLIDAMASGGSVLQAASLMDDLKEQHKNLVGVEMESYAVFTAAEYAATPRPLCISIKSVCDFGDETKEDNAHEYAAYTSARFLYHFALAAFSNDD